MQAIIVLPPVKVKKGLFRKKNKKGKGKGALKNQPALVQGLAVVTNSTLAISRPPVDPNAPAPSPPKPSMAATKSTPDTSNSDLPASTPSSTDTTFARTSAPHSKVHALKQESSSAALSLPDFGLTPTPSPAPSLFVKPAAVRALQAAEPPAQRNSDEHAGVTADLYLQALSSFDEPAPETKAAAPAPKPQEVPAPAPVATLTAPAPIRTRARSGTTVMHKPPSPQMSVKVVPMEPKAEEKEVAPSPKQAPVEPISAPEVVDEKIVEEEPEDVASPAEIPVQVEEVKAIEPEAEPVEEPEPVAESKPAEEVEEIKPVEAEVIEPVVAIEPEAVEEVEEAAAVVESPEPVAEVKPIEQPVFVKRKPSLEVQIVRDEVPSLPSSPMSPLTPSSPSSPSRPIIRNLSQPPTPNGVRGTHNEGSLQSVRATAQLFAQRLASKAEADPVKPRAPLPKRVQTFTPGGPVFRRPGDVDNKPTSDARRAQTMTN